MNGESIQDIRHYWKGWDILSSAALHIANQNPNCQRIEADSFYHPANPDRMAIRILEALKTIVWLGKEEVVN